MPLRELFTLFVDWCREHRAANTVRHYQSRLRTLLERFGDRDLRTLTPIEVEAWLRAAGRNGDESLKAPDTRRANAVVFLRFQSWAVERKALDAPILAKIEKPAGRKRERVPTEQEFTAILARAGREFGLIYRALKQSGARPGELAAAQIEDWDRKNRAIVLIEHKTARKTGAPRRIPVGSKLAALLNEACAGRRSGPLFRQRSGQPWTTAALSRTFRALRRKARLSDELVLYLTRHWHATELCKKVDIHAASVALGHTNIRTTQRYLHTTSAELVANQDLID